MNELHILDAGRADCTVLLLDTLQGRKTVVLDGGSCARPDHTPLRSFLRRKSIRSIDLAILTHLHQDHFGGFFPVVEDGVLIKKLLTPCGDLVFDERVYPLFGDREFYREYHQIFLRLAGQGTEICLPERYAGRSFTFGDTVLRCLYPSSAEEPESVRCARLLCRTDLSDEEIDVYLERHKRACNGDSSIWGLYRGTELMALLTGDCPDTRIQQLLRAGGPLRPAVQKLSHHGLGQGYFSVETQAALHPGTLVMTIDRAQCGDALQHAVDALCAAGGSTAHYTWQGDFVLRF